MRTSFRLLLYMLLLGVWSCQEDLPHEILPAEDDKQIEAATALERLKLAFRNDYDSSALRSASSGGHDQIFALEEAQPLWQYSREFSRADGATITCTAVSASLCISRISSKFDPSDIAKYGAQLSHVFLIRREHPTDSTLVGNYFLVFAPSKKYVNTGNRVFTTETLIPEAYDGEVDLYDLKGNIISTYRYTDGRCVTQRQYSSTLKSYRTECHHVLIHRRIVYSTVESSGLDEPDNYLNGFDPVIVSETVPESALICQEAYVIDQPGGGGKGGGGLDAYRGGYPIASGGTSKKDYDPCAQIKELLQKPEIAEKIKELMQHREEQREITNQNQNEKGYVQMANGEFKELKPMEKQIGEHALQAEFPAGALGIIHSHTSATTNEYGDSMNPIQMFSPGDVEGFLILLSKVRKSKDASLEDAYCILVADEGVFAMRYVGTEEMFLKDFAEVNASLGKIKGNKSEQLKAEYRYYMSNKPTGKSAMRRLSRFISEYYGGPSIAIQWAKYKEGEMGSTRSLVPEQGENKTEYKMKDC